MSLLCHMPFVLLLQFIEIIGFFGTIPLILLAHSDPPHVKIKKQKIVKELW
jgi:hypothetical protein